MELVSRIKMLPMQDFLDRLRYKLTIVLICILLEAPGHVFNSRLFCLQRTLPPRCWLKYHRVPRLLNRPGTSPFFQVPFCTSNASSPASWATPSGPGRPRSGSFSRVRFSFSASLTQARWVRKLHSIGHVAMRPHFLLSARTSAPSQARTLQVFVKIYWSLLDVIP
jgi:hypothetical protein